METSRFRRFGTKTLIMFVLRRGGLFFVAALVFLLLSLLSADAPSELAIFIPTVLHYDIILAMFGLATALVLGMLEYGNYSILLNDLDFRVMRGIFNINEIGFPYKRVKEVHLDRTVLDRLMGLGTLKIVAGDEEADDTTTLILPLLGEEVARAIQSEILRRSEVEEIRKVDLTSVGV